MSQFLRLDRRALVLAPAVAALVGCAGMARERSETRRGASVMRYLFPDDSTTAAIATADVATLRVPLTVGVGFVPSSGSGGGDITDVQQQEVLARVVESFKRYPFIAELKPVPTTYFRAGGGFADLERVARAFELDVVALISYDQVLFTEKTRSSFWYWTAVGAFVAHGDQYDVHTLLESTVVDVKSRRLLFRAAGASAHNGGASLSDLAAATRSARATGFRKAGEDLLSNLRTALEEFRERARAGRGGTRVETPPGYDPAASAPRR